jgi:hypothetical protein
MEPYEGLGHWYKIPDEIDYVVRIVHKKCGWEIKEQPNIGERQIEGLACCLSASTIAEE